MLRKQIHILCFASLASFQGGVVQAETHAVGFGDVALVNKENYTQLADIIRGLNENGTGLLILGKDIPTGELPVKIKKNVRVIDLRYNGAIHIIRGHHPRIEGIWPQYTGLETGLGKNIVITDVLTKETPIENWQGKPAKPADTKFQDEFDYPDRHNHYQNFLSEVWNFTPNINGVAIWGDAGAFVPGSKAWGGFLSARSWPVHWEKYVPEGSRPFEDKEFDAQLVGLEIDVLNGGLPFPEKMPGSAIPLGKTGLQIVGFGKRNNAAIEIRCEDSDAEIEHRKRRGMWNYGVIAHHSLDRNSTFLYSAYPEGRRGLDLELTDYREGAIRIKSTQENTGILFNEGRGGQIYVDADTNNTLVIRAGVGGLRILSPDGRQAGIFVRTSHLYTLAAVMISAFGVMVYLQVNVSRKIRAIHA